MKAMRITQPANVNPWARAAFETAHHAYVRGDLAEARAALLRALDSQPDFVDAHYWLARLTDDPQAKRRHLTNALVHLPNHLDALRDLMVLDGRLTPEQAAQTHHHAEAETRQAAEPVRMTTTVLICPVCGGDLTVDPNDGHVECRFCGYRAEKAPQPATDGSDLLAAALLERKATNVRWKIGRRLLHCNRCGAERTIPATALSTRCPFCNSNHVVQQDALGSFQQPDGLLPFRVSQEQAEARIRKRLRRLDERLAGLIDTNAMRRLELEGVYLPFWLFDALADVTQTITPKAGRYGKGPASLRLPQTSTFRDGCFNLPVPAMSKPHATLLRGLNDFDMGQMVAYQPKLLARHPAALYDIDFDQASLEARSEATRRMREKHGQTNRDDVEVRVSTLVVQMSFRLVLMPVWLGVITEADGDLRQALVSGQTGKVVLGKAQKPKRR
ncbi:MAG: hypothetical protein DIU68_019580 [Chloroflexota bacterium]|nr:MAG: hypothetical protein DIU68_12200 [Chloroflexota bacterium]